MNGEVEVFLDETPGETRGVILRDGRFDRLILHFDDDPPQNRLCARSIGRVTRVEPGLRGAFIDLGAGDPAGFLPWKGQPPRVGEKIEVVVVAEPRESKGPALRRVGAGQGDVRLLSAGPTVAEQLARLAPGAEIHTGAEAIRAGMEAAKAALASREILPDLGLDIAVQRTRALIAVDIDHAGGRGRDHANRAGLSHAARLIRLKSWGGLVAVDLAGVNHDGAAVGRMARDAFADEPEAAIGPISRFGLLQLSLPWRRTPAEERLASLMARRVTPVRHLALRLLEDRGLARATLYVAPSALPAAAPLVARLGPRAVVAADPALSADAFRIEEA